MQILRVYLVGQNIEKITFTLNFWTHFGVHSEGTILIILFPLFLQAYKLSMTRGDYVWIIPFWYADHWWTVQELDIGCSVEEMTKALYSTNILTVSQDFLSQTDDVTVSGFVSRVVSRDLQTSNISIWRYHCLGRGGISEDLKSIIANLVYRSLESTLDDMIR